MDAEALGVDCNRWGRAAWFYMAEDAAEHRKEAVRTGPVTTQQLVTLFVDGQVDGMTLVWSQELDGWKPIGVLDGNAVACRSSAIVPTEEAFCGCR
jgi:HIV Tat-specific factor 1